MTPSFLVECVELFLDLNPVLLMHKNLKDRLMQIFLTCYIQVYKYLYKYRFLYANLAFFMCCLSKSVPIYAFVSIQLNRSSSSVKAAAELVIDDHGVRFKGQASQTKLGFKQVFELYHSLPQVQVKFSSIDVTFNNSS